MPTWQEFPTADYAWKVHLPDQVAVKPTVVWLSPYFPPPDSRVRFGSMHGTDPPEKDRRSSPREAPSYTTEQLKSLRIVTVHFREDFMFCLLSDGNRVCVPVTISPALQAASHGTRYQWQVAEDGKAIVWYTTSMGVPTAHVTLWDILAHPEAQISRV